MTSLTDQPEVKELAERFNLDVPKNFRGVVTDWEIIPDALCDPYIIIREIEMYDTDGKLVKTADLSVLSENIHKFSLVFRKHENVQE